MAKNKFDNDFKEVKILYPELEFSIINGTKYKYKINGILNITDSEGSHRGVFRVSLYFKANYPFGFGALQEISNVIPREIDRHINPDGFCCICGPIELARYERKNVTILHFIQMYVIPFLANQIHFDEYGYFLNGEYSHNNKGLWESLEEEFQTKDSDKINSILEYILSKPTVNHKCYCGSGRKLKHCHVNTVDLILSVLKKHNI